MPKTTKKLTPKEVRSEFVSLMNSCVEGYTGEWDPSGEGRDGFEAMYNGIKKLARHYKVNVIGAGVKEI